MKKLRNLQKGKLNSIVQTNYVVIDLITYNQMVRMNILQGDKISKIYNIIYEGDSTEVLKYRKIKQLLLREEEL